MRKALRYSLFLSVLLALTFPLSSCDSGGSNSSSSSAEWTGNWKLIEVNGEATDRDAAWSISEDEIKSVADFRGDCAVDGDPDRWKITNVEGNTLTIEGQTDGTLDGKFEADVGSGGNLTITIVSGGDAPEGSTQTFKPIDQSIEEAVGC
jgi:hypothetical protein